LKSTLGLLGENPKLQLLKMPLLEIFEILDILHAVTYFSPVHHRLCMLFCHILRSLLGSFFGRNFLD
jgi:hypothetical protein